MTMRAIRTAGMVVVFVLAGLWIAEPVAAQDNDGHEVKTNGHKQLEGHDPHKPGLGKTFVRRSSLCSALHKANDLKKQGKLKNNTFSLGKNAKLNFKAHDPWMVKLLCDFIDHVQKREFSKYKVRQAYVSEVLKALQSGKGRPASTIANFHDLIDQANIRVGDQIYGITRWVDEQQKLHVKQEKKPILWFARSYEHPHNFLIGISARFFRLKNRKPRPIDLIRAGERLILRLFVDAKGVELLQQHHKDGPTTDIGADLLRAAKAFRRAALPNTTNVPQVTLENNRRSPHRNVIRKKPLKLTALPRNLGNWLQLSIDDNAKPDVDPKNKKENRFVPGVTLFIYRPIPRVQRGGRNARSWFLKDLAGAAASGGEAEGIMFPFDILSLRAATIFQPESVVDETTTTKIVTNFEVWAAAVARIYYFAQPTNKLTQLVFGHESDHFEKYKDVWGTYIADSDGALARAFMTLRDKLNNALLLNKTEAFHYEGSQTVELPWRFGAIGPFRLASRSPKGKIRTSASLPLRDQGLWEGWVDRQNWHNKSAHFAAMHSTRPVSVIRFRLSRTAQSNIKIVDAIKHHDKANDKKTKQAGKIWEKWRENEFRKIKYERTRILDLKELELDAKEGQITEKGLAKRPEVARLIKLYNKVVLPFDRQKKKSYRYHLDPDYILQHLR